MDASRHVTPGRLRRLAEELAEEHMGIIERSSAPDVLVDELDYALRPPRHERRVPSYGSFVLPTRPTDAWGGHTGLEIVSSGTADVVDDEVRRFADGLTSWTVRTRVGVDSLVVFDRAAGSERDLVVLARASGATVVQRHPAGEVRVVGSFGVARWDGLGWQVQPMVDSWLAWASCGLPEGGTDVLDAMLRFAVHDLGALGIGALLVYRPADLHAHQLERRLPTPPPLNIDRPTDLAPLRHVLSQIDGAALFDERGELLELGVRLVPSPGAEADIEAVRGTRHTSARRYSHDDPDAVVIVVSEDGPVTVFRGGDIIGHSSDGSAR